MSYFLIVETEDYEFDAFDNRVLPLGAPGAPLRAVRVCCYQGDPGGD